MLAFRLYCDEGFRSEYRRGYVDPVDMQSKEGCVELAVYRCIKDGSKSCLALYDDSSWPNAFVDGWQNVCPPSMRVNYKRYSLADFIVGQGTVQAHLSELTSKDYEVPEA